MGLLAVAACEKAPVTPETEPQKEAEVYDVRIAPVMTKVTQTAFEEGDAIGVTITRTGGVYATNEKMSFDGSVFSGSLKWYAEGAEGATLAAYYPYSAGGSSSFAVQADQSAGTSASDFVAGIKEGVLPSAHAVTVPFKHKLSAIQLNVTNNAQGDLASVALKGAKLVANIAADFTATVDETAPEGTVKAAKTGEDTYMLVVPPQTVAFVVTATTAGGNELSQILQEVTLEGGKKYSIGLIVNPDDLLVALGGDVQDWEDGGEIGGDNTLIEKLSDGYITYHGDKYTVAKMKDNKWWMTQNMRYVPAGITPSSDLSAVTAGVFNPLTIVEGARAFTADEAVVVSNGYLYQGEVALGLKVGDIVSESQAKALEGVQGICPKGWHVPTKADITNLVGKGVGITTKTDAPYYDGANGSIALLNADGFNMAAYGMVSIANTSTTTGALQGVIYNGQLASSMMCGSTFAKIDYNTAGDADSGIKNIQFVGLMPMTNKATEAEMTCNGTNVSYRIAGPLRCVRNE